MFIWVRGGGRIRGGGLRSGGGRQCSSKERRPAAAAEIAKSAGERGQGSWDPVGLGKGPEN